MAGRVFIQTEDYSGELSSMQFATGAVSAVTVDQWLLDVTDFTDKLQLILEVNIIRIDKIASETPSAPGAIVHGSTNKAAWRVEYVDTVTGRVHSLTHGTPIPDFLVAGSDRIDMDDADVIAYIAAFEALVVAPDTGNAVEISSITFIGRNRK